MGVEKIGIVRKIVRKLFKIDPFPVWTSSAPELSDLDVIGTYDNPARLLILWHNEDLSLEVVEMPMFKTEVREQLWMAAIIYLLKYKLI